MDTRERILKGTGELFKKFGIRSVTMDDIARELGMSKKTLYQYFPNKAGLVQGIAEGHICMEIEMSNSIHKEADDPIQEVILLIRQISKTFQEIPTQMVYDVQRYYPRAWDLFNNFKNQHAFQMVKESLERGVQQGLFRKEMDLDLIAKIRVEQITMCFDPELFPPTEYDIAKLMVQSTELFLHGLVTMKGKKLIYKYLNRSEDE